MSKFLPVSGKEMCKILEMIGFQKVHQVGSHVRYAHPLRKKIQFIGGAKKNLYFYLLKDIYEPLL
jgi:predicted RNA binding protein YcfA (HicA-like mRNA interferase family)